MGERGEIASMSRLTVREALSEMKDVSKLMLDLAYGALILNSKEIAAHVLELEEQVDRMLYQLLMSLTLAADDPRTASQVLPLYKVAYASKIISDAAADIAKITLLDVGLHSSLLEAIGKSEEPISCIKVSRDSILAYKGLRELRLPSRLGTYVRAIKRKGEWIYDPRADTSILPDDLLIVRGDEEGIKVFDLIARGVKCELEILERAPRELAKRTYIDELMELLTEMKDKSELTIDLAYSSLLFNSREIASEVKELEEDMDELRVKVEKFILIHSHEVREPEPLLGFLRLSVALETVADAAYEIADVVLRGLLAHEVLQSVLSEADETLVKAEIAKGALLDGRALAEARIETETGFRIIAVKRGKEWIYAPRGDLKLVGGDIVIARGPPEGKDLFERLAYG